MKHTYSRYNFLFENGSHYVLYNTATDGILLLRRPLLGLLQDDDPEPLRQAYSALYDTMLERRQDADMRCHVHSANPAAPRIGGGRASRFSGKLPVVLIIRRFVKCLTRVLAKFFLMQRLLFCLSLLCSFQTAMAQKNILLWGLVRDQITSVVQKNVRATLMTTDSVVVGVAKNHFAMPKY